MAAISETTATFLVSTLAFPFAAASVWKKDAIRRSRLSAAGVIEITSMCRLEYDHDHTTGRRFGA